MDDPRRLQVQMAFMAFLSQRGGKKGSGSAGSAVGCPGSRRVSSSSSASRAMPAGGREDPSLEQAGFSSRMNAHGRARQPLWASSGRVCACVCVILGLNAKLADCQDPDLASPQLPWLERLPLL